MLSQFQLFVTAFVYTFLSNDIVFIKSDSPIVKEPAAHFRRSFHPPLQAHNIARYAMSDTPGCLDKFRLLGGHLHA